MNPIIEELHPGGSGVLAAPLLAVAVLALTVGTWVVIRERGRQVSLSFLASTLALAVYLFGFAFMAVAPDPATAVAWGRVAYVGIPLIVPSIYQFSVDLLGMSERRRVVVWLAWALGLLYMILAVGTDLLVTGVRTTEWGYITSLSPWNLPILFWSTTLIILVIRDYTRAYAEAEVVQKARIRWFAIPLAIACLGFIDYAPSLGLAILPIGFVFFPVFLLSAAWAVERYHLPDLTPAFAAGQIVETMADALLVCETRGRIALANAAAERLFGYQETDLRGLQLGTLFGPHQADSLARSTVSEREITALTRRGDRIDVSVSTGRIQDRSGRTMGTVVVARDIRERKRAAAEIERREQRFRALTENGLDTITILDADGRVRYQSPSVRQLGYDPQGDIGIRIFDRAHPEDAARLHDAFRTVLRDPDATTEVEARIRTAQGGYRHFELRGRNLLDHPAVGGVVVNGRDITEERELEAQLQQAQKMEAIGRLAGGVAHDFNNILTAIQGNIALMAESLPPDSTLRPELDEVRSGAERAARLTDQLLAFSRRQVVRPRLLDLEEVIADLRSMLERLITEDVTLATRFGPDIGRVRADRVHIEQVVMNLVVNARDAMIAGGRIEIATERVEMAADEAAAIPGATPGSYARLTVSDDGHGMDATTRARIFEPFFTTKDQGKGTGLGLSTVYGTVRQAGGFITVESEPGRGTRFSVYLPREEAGDAADSTDVYPAHTRTDTTPEPGSHTPPTGINILVVEDERPVRALMKKILGRKGYVVLEAADGEDALRVAAAFPGEIHLLVTDLVMPGLGGREVAERLVGERPDLRTIFVSGYTADEVVRRGVVSGEHVFLGKPFTPAALVACVGDVLEEARAVV